jgi:predicted MFS family arabinose efflux permease
MIAWASEERLLAYALFLGAVMFVIVPFFKSALPIGIISFVFGFGLNSSQPICLMLLYSRSLEGRSGEALGLRFALDNAARLASPVIFGVVASGLGLSAVFWISSVLLGAGGMVTRADAARGHRK